jgi:hypothetical protein
VSAPESNLAETKALLLGMVAEANDLRLAAGGSITDAVAAWLAPQYLLAARDKLAATNGGGRFEVLRVFMHDWALLRRGDHSAARLQLDREQLDWQRANSQAQKQKEFREWIQRPEVLREFLPDQTGGIRPENRGHESPQRRCKNPAYRQAFERLDEALAQNTQSDNTEKIRLIRQAAFADVDAFEKSHPFVLPK